MHEKPMKKIVLFLIRFYQRWLSRLKGKPCCRFYPTCSSYTLGAVERFGVVKGLWLGMLRILRCNPLFEGGIDPVPDQFVLFPRRRRSPQKENTRPDAAVKPFLDIDVKK